MSRHGSLAGRVSNPPENCDTAYYVGNNIVSCYKNSPPLEGCPQGRGGRMDEWDKSPVPLGVSQNAEASVKLKQNTRLKAVASRRVFLYCRFLLNQSFCCRKLSLLKEPPFIEGSPHCLLNRTVFCYYSSGQPLIFSSSSHLVFHNAHAF